MSMAWEVSNDDVANVLDGMVSRGEIAPYNDDQLESWADQLDVDAIEDAALYGCSMDEQIGYAENEILSQLRQIFGLTVT